MHHLDHFYFCVPPDRHSFPCCHLVSTRSPPTSVTNSLVFFLSSLISTGRLAVTATLRPSRAGDTTYGPRLPTAAHGFSLIPTGRPAVTANLRPSRAGDTTYGPRLLTAAHTTADRGGGPLYSGHTHPSCGSHDHRPPHAPHCAGTPGLPCRPAPPAVTATLRPSRAGDTTYSPRLLTAAPHYSRQRGGASPLRPHLPLLLQPQSSAPPAPHCAGTPGLPCGPAPPQPQHGLNFDHYWSNSHVTSIAYDRK